MCKATRCDASSEPPGFRLGTSWTVRIAMLMYKEERKKKKKAEGVVHGK
jgi:hypothetical protein